MCRDPWEAAVITPHENQRKFIDALIGTDCGTIFHFGSARAGKSVAACLGLLCFGYRYPGSRTLIGRYDFRALDRSTMVSMGEAIGWLFQRDYTHVQDVEKDIGNWAKVRGILTLRGGPQFEFQHFKDAGQLGSTEYANAWIEEAQEIPGRMDEGEDRTPGSRTPEVIGMIQSRLNVVCQSEKWGPSKPKLALTAMGWGHNWVWDMGIGNKGPQTLTLESNAEDNRANIPEEWFERMRGLPESEQRRYLFLSHDEFQGRVFLEFGPQNVVPQFLVPKEWPVIRAHDPGVTGAGWVWISTICDLGRLKSKGWKFPEGFKDGDTVTWDEYGPYEVPIEDQIAHVKELDAKLKPVFTGIDPSDARQQTGRGLKTAKQLLEESGIAPVRKAPNDETTFIQKAKQVFTSKRSWITKNCTGLIRQLTDEIWDEKSRPGERKRKYAGPFHILAAWKYGLLLKPELLTAEPTPVRKGKYGTSSRSGY